MTAMIATSPSPKGRRVRLALDNIKVDMSIQSRVAMSMADAKEFTEAMLRGDAFPPVTVFYDGKHYWLADGFHRNKAAKAAGLKDILCEVFDGTKDDAYVFSAGANKKFSIKRTAEDIKKACEMLFALPEWWDRADTILAKHVGVAPATVSRHRADWGARMSVAIPPAIVMENGQVRRRSARKGKSSVSQIRGQNRFQAAVGSVWVKGASPEAVDEKVRQIRGLGDYRLAQYRALKFSIDSSGIPASAHHVVSSGRAGTFLLAGRSVSVLAKFHEDRDVFAPVGRVLMARHVAGKPDARCVVVGYKINCDKDVIAVAESMGIEFLTPDEFIESLKAEKE